MTEVTVKIMHRTALVAVMEGGELAGRIPFWSNYVPGDELVQVARFEVPFPACGQVLRLLGIIFQELNVDEPQTEWAKAYRARGNRSLSVGDVVVCGESAWACARAGWQPVTLDARQIWFDIGRVAD